MRSVYRAMRARRIQQPKHPAVRFQPLALFKNSEPGVWYDPSDLSTLFQDSAGTTPVTAVEQPVGLMLDKSKGLVLGPELVTNGTFDTSIDGWSTVSPVTASWTSAGIRVSRNSTSFQNQAATPISLVAGNTYFVSVDVSVGPTNAYGGLEIWNADRTTALYLVGYFRRNAAGNLAASFVATSTENALVVVGISGATTGTVTFDNISVRELPGNHASQTTATSRPVLSARVNQYLATETLATQNVTTLAAQYRLSFEGAGTITLSGTATGVYSAGSHLITCTAGTLTSTVSGSVTKADLRVANDGANLPPYQRVNTATDYDTVGFPHYLRFDGVDDWLVTNTITPGIDKAQVFAGVRKLSDATRGTLVETGDTHWTVNGFSVQAPATSIDAGASSPFANYYAAVSDGNGAGVGDYDVFNTQNVYPSPSTNTISAVFDRGAAPLSKTNLRVNGVVPTKVTGSFTGTAVTGNVLNTPLYIGRRAGTSFSFNGHIYSLIVRFGSNLPAATIEKTEKYINTKTRAF